MQTWICDTCGEKILSPDAGWVEWHYDDEGRYSNYRIVHHLKPGCQAEQNPDLAHNHLSYFTGAEGLTNLLSFIERNPEGSRDLSILIHRIQVPGYEQALSFVDRAVCDGLIDESEIESVLYPDQVKLILDTYNKE